MIVEWIIGLDAWAWIILGVVLIGLELAAPGVFLLWLGLAAVATGLVDGMAGLSWQASTLLFAALSVVAVLVGRALSRPDVSRETSSLNRRGAALVGRIFVLEAPITAGEGRIRVDDSSWRVTGPDQPAGASVRVVRVEGATLMVEAAERTSH
ncbi:MAG TPA: NfeD family protein [Microvirga sp.]|jgi:membrane protein implicated in regulation of membrane protease activity|nr:NfeD family protein [Microvirga sp.]